MFRWIFGRRSDDDLARTPESASRLSAEELAKIGTAEDPLLDYEAGLERNFAAMAAERTGRIERAIELYEISVSGGFVESHPYERLATIYERRNTPAEAIRVLNVFVDLARSGTLPRGAQRSAERRLPEIQRRLHRLSAAAGEAR